MNMYGIYMSLFFCFCFHKNLRELNGVRMRMNGEKDGELREKRVCLYLFLWDN